MGASGTAEPETNGDEALSDIDALIEAIVADELESLRRAFADGAEFAVTRAGRRDETLHRLECPSIAPLLDRRTRWTETHRRRLAADRDYRLALPSLVTRARAGSIAGVRGCRVCWPNIAGTEPRPLKRITARALGARHAGRVLATESGESLGAIISVAALTGADLFGVERDEIEVVTSAQTVRYAPTASVHLWDVPSDGEAMERRVRLLALLGTPVAPTW